MYFPSVETVAPAWVSFNVDRLVPDTGLIQGVHLQPFVYAVSVHQVRLAEMGQLYVPCMCHVALALFTLTHDL